LRPPRPDVTVGLEAFYDHIPLGLVPPEISKGLFLMGVVLAVVEVRGILENQPRESFL
jgi:hypothetical protein